MSILHLLESLSPFAKKKGWLNWTSGRRRALQCPACHTDERMHTRCSVATPYSKHRRYRLYDCAHCGTAHAPDISAPLYEDQRHGGNAENFTAPKKFYVEQGAGFEAMIAPFFWARKNNIKTLLEVGCGYGFSLDFAARGLGWTAQGIDPSHIARQGAEELGLPILDGYLGADTELDNMPFDLVYSSEVIEHIATPDPFVDVLARAAGDQGTLLLTTPDIAGLQAERAIEEIIPLLSPGAHLVLYSKNGLKSCLHRAGFTNVEVTSTGDTIYAFASKGPLNVDFSAPIDRNILTDYMKNRLAAKDMPHHLRTGFAGRLLRAQTDAGEYQAAQKTLNILKKLWQEAYALDLDTPQSIEQIKKPEDDFISYAASRPFTLTSALYCAGIVALNGQRDQALALGYFQACTRAYAVMEPILTVINASDLDSRNLAHSAGLLAAGILTQTDPKKAIDAFKALDSNIQQSYPAHYKNTLLEVFAAAANTGDYSHAEQLRPNVEAALEGAPCDGAFSRAAAMGMAMMALNYRFDRAAGLFWLRKALENAPKETQWENMRKIWVEQAKTHGIELLVHGGQQAFNAKRDDICAALQDIPAEGAGFAICEALGLAYLADQPEKALIWLEHAYALADDAHKESTQARIKAANVHIFIHAVSAGNHDMAARANTVIKDIVADTNDPGLLFALGLDALNRRGDLEDAERHFAALTTQTKNPDLGVQGAFHLAMVLARKGEMASAKETAETLYARTNPNAPLVRRLVGERQAELDAAIVDAA